MTGCPPWCVEPHDDGERRHLAELRNVAATADGTDAHIPHLYFDVRQEPGELRPLIHVGLDDKPVARHTVARLTVAEAINAGNALIFLAMLAGDS